MAISASLGTPALLRVAGGALAYRDSGGDGVPVVFVHGVFVNGDLWHEVVPALGAGFRCIAPDWPLGGHEYAMAPHADLSPPAIAAMLGELLEALDLRGAILVASDTGSAFVQLALVSRPDRVGGVVFTNGDVFEHFFPAPLGALPKLARVPGAMEALLAPLRLPGAGYALAAPIALATPPAAVLASWLGPLANAEVRRDLRKVVAAVDPRYTLEAATHFASFAKPVAVVWGTEDAFFPPAVGERLARAFPDATLEPVANAKLLVPVDAPVSVANGIRDVARRAGAHAG